MSEFHGVKVKETFTTPAPVMQTNTLPVYFGTAPIHLAENPEAAVNSVILARSFQEFKQKLGYSDDWASYTLCEAAYAHFEENQQVPVAFVNVLTTSDVETIAPAAATLAKGSYTIAKQGVLKNSVTVTDAGGTTTYKVDKDYRLTFDDAGNLVVSTIQGGTIQGEAAQLKIGYKSLKPSMIQASHIIGGTDPSTGVRKGLELIEDVFVTTSLVPNLIVALGWSHNPLVAAVMVAKARDINGLFEAHAVTDLDATQKYVTVAQWKKDNGYTDHLQTNVYPKFQRKGRTYHGSTVLTVAMLATDQKNGGIPSQTPSNQLISMDACVYKDGTPVYIPFDQANMLNANGIVTAMKWQDGLRAWGNRTGAYPEYSDPQRTFIPVRRMFSYVKNNLVLRHWQKIDNPLLPRLIEAVADDANVWLNGLVASGHLLGGRVEFHAEDNPKEQFANGKIVYRVFITPPSVTQEIEFIVSYETSYLATLG